MPSESEEPRGDARRGERELTPSAVAPTPPRSSRIVQSPRVAAVTLAERTVLVDAGAGRRLALDRFGGRVWASLARQPTLPALVEQLREDGLRTEQLAEDVARVLTRCLEMGLIAWR